VDASRGSPGGEIRTFLIADVRGYTHFTEEHGDERAAELAKRFARLARDVVADNGGEVIELRGDEALAVFTSARLALRSAVDLQRRSRTDSALPLGIGIGLDAGEAMPVDGGYRGGALNLASRLCGMAAPGQILASETVVGLARKVDGVRFAKRRPARLKGMEEPVPVIEAVPDPPLPPLPAPPVPRRSFLRRRRWPLIATATAAIGLAVALPLVLSSGGRTTVPESVISVPRSFVGLIEIDPRTNRLVHRIRLTGPPVGYFAYRSIWLAVPDGINRVDPKSGRILARIPITGGLGDGGLGASTHEGVWVASPDLEPFALLEVDPFRNNTVTQRLRLAGRPTAGPYLGEGFVWVVVGSNTILRIDPQTARVVGRIAYNFPEIGTASNTAVGEGSLWIADRRAVAPGHGLDFGVVVRIDARTDKIVAQIPVSRAFAVAVGAGAVWVASDNGTVSEINPETNRVIRPIHLPRADALAVGPDAVWVVNGRAHTALRLDPATGDVVYRLRLPPTAQAIADWAGSLWVGVWPE
jgi:class 3 adenylate cyclase